MLKVLTPDEVIELVDKEFSVLNRIELLPLTGLSAVFLQKTFCLRNMFPILTAPL